MLGVLNRRQRRERRETRPSVRSVFSCWIWRLRCIARTGGAHLDIPTIAELSCSLSLRGTSGERDGEGYSIKVPSSPQPSPPVLLLWGGEGEHQLRPVCGAIQ